MHHLHQVFAKYVQRFVYRDSSSDQMVVLKATQNAEKSSVVVISFLDEASPSGKRPTNSKTFKEKK